MGEALELRRSARERGAALTVDSTRDRNQGRLEALCRRTRAREAWDGKHAAEEAEREALRKRLLVCEDALLAVGVLSALFARRKGALGLLRSGAEAQEMLSSGRREEKVGVSEGDALTALCTRSGRPLEKAAAKEALAHLLGNASGWFHLEVSHFGRTEVRNLMQIPGGGPGETIASLRAERAELEGRQAEDVARDRVAIAALARAGDPEFVTGAAVTHGPPAAAAARKRPAEENKNVASLRRLRQKTAPSHFWRKTSTSSA